MVETHNFYQQKHVGPTCINRKKLSDQLGNGQGFFRTMGYKVILAEKIQSKKENWVVFIFSDYNFGTQLGRYFFLSTLVDGVDHYVNAVSLVDSDDKEMSYLESTKKQLTVIKR